MDEFDLGSIDPGAFSLDDIDSMLADFSGADLGSIDVSPENLDFTSADLGQLDPNAFSFDDLDQLLSDSSWLDNAAESLSSSIDLTQGANLGGLGLTATGRGQLSMVDPETGATGLTAEGFRNIQDLLGSGTAEEIARYTPGTADYSLRSGLETEDGQGLSADATRGMGLTSMGGGQGISKYIPAEYGGSVLEDLVKNNPGEFGAIEDYLNSEIYGGKGLDPFAGTGGTLSQAGFLEQSSAANPLGAKYSLGDPSSFINRPSITGQQAVVSDGRTVIDNGDGTFKVVTVKDDGTTVTKIVDTKGNPVVPDKPTGPGGTKTTPGTKQQNLGSLLPLLLALLAMNKGGGSSGASNATIPSLGASRSQTPYGQVQQAAGYRPGQGGITYFTPMQYMKGMGLAKGGIAELNRGRLLRGPGDGVSDSIPAVIGGMADGGQPARLARGEYVIDARTVAALGNGSTDAGAERLDQMRKKILADDRKAKVGKDSKAYRHLA